MTSAADVLEGRARWAVLQTDCLEWMPLLEAGQFDHVIGDPPFTQRTTNNARGFRGKATFVPFITFDGIDGQEGRIATECLRAAKRWVVLFCAFEQLGAYAAATGPAWVRSGVWHKPDGAPQFTGDRPAMCGEALAIMHNPGRKRWNGGGHQAFWSMGYERERNGHPTPKPLSLMLELVEQFTDPDEAVLDPFAGSATTGVACLRLGRRFIGIEKDPEFAKVATERLQAESQGLTLRAARAGQLSLLGGLK